MWLSSQQRLHIINSNINQAGQMATNTFSFELLFKKKWPKTKWKMLMGQFTVKKEATHHLRSYSILTTTYFTNILWCFQLVYLLGFWGIQKLSMSHTRSNLYGSLKHTSRASTPSPASVFELFKSAASNIWRLDISGVSTCSEECF